MAKRKIPGLSKSKGMQSMFTLFPPGKYGFTIESVTSKDSKKGTSTIHTFKMKCVEAFDPDNAAMVDKLYYQRLIEMHDDHPSYEEYNYIFVDELKSIVDATGVQFKADSLDFEDFVDTSLIAAITQVDGQDAEGNPRKENRINKYEALD